MEWIVTVLDFFGLAPDKYPFLVLAILIVGGVAYIRLSIGNKLGKIKDNVLVVITHLSSGASNRGRLDTALIQVMSPMVITDEGRRVLQESGFIAIMENPDHRAVAMSALFEQEPRTKLDVENYAIVYFATLLERDFMSPVKAYLYNNPNTRQTYVTLAGIYVRDAYLKDHPEIVQ